MKLLTAQLLYEMVNAAADGGAPLTTAQRTAIEPVLESVAGQYNKAYDCAMKVLESNGTDPREKFAMKNLFSTVDNHALADLFRVLGLPMRDEIEEPAPEPA